MTFAFISNIVTGVSVIVLLLLFIWRLRVFLGNVNPIITDLKNYDSNHISYGFTKSTILKKIKEQYNQSFLDAKTESKADTYFTIDGINTINFNLGFYGGYNNTLIGLGIFFTFVGLTLGVGYFGYNLSNADADNQSEAIMEGINVLMGGMGTAFISSVLGMFFSLWFSKTYKEKVNAIDAGLTQISNDLDSKFLKTASDFAIEREEHLIHLIDSVIIKNNNASDLRMNNALQATKLTYVDESDRIVGLATMTKQILLESKRQSDSLTTFSDDIADALYDAMNREDNDNASITSILRDGFQKLLEAERDPVNDLVDNLLVQLNKTFAKMTEDITTSIESVMKNIQNETGGKVVEQANEAALELNKVTDHISKLPDILNQVNTQTDQTASFTKEVIQKVNETIIHLQEVIKLQSIAAQEIESATQIYADKRSEMNNSLDTIKNTSRSLEKAVSKLDTDFDTYKSHTTTLEESRTENLTTLSSIISNAAKMNTDLIENLEEIESSVETTFSKISEGLNGYHSQISHNTNVELRAYSTAVSEITEKLQGVAVTLNHSIEDLDNRLGTKLN